MGEVSTCTKCRESKPVSDFYRNRARANGLAAWCKTCTKEATSSWYQRNKARHREVGDRWKDENREAWAAYQRGWQDRNRDKMSKAEQAYRERHPGRIRLAQVAYRDRHPERHLQLQRARTRLRRSRKKASTRIAYTSADLQRRMEFFGERCYVCGQDYEQIDHVKPLAKGGPDMLSNLRPICAGCNRRKNAKWHGAKALPALLQSITV